MAMLNILLTGLQTILVASGGFIILMNIITISVHIKESQGTQLTASVLGILGGVLLIICAVGVPALSEGLTPTATSVLWIG